MLAINAILFHWRSVTETFSFMCVESKCDMLRNTHDPLLDALIRKREKEREREEREEEHMDLIK